MTQTERIYNWLKKEGSITSKEAEEFLAVYRLSARISEMRASGMHIRTETEKGKNRFGQTVYFAKYVLEEDDAEI